MPCMRAARPVSGASSPAGGRWPISRAGSATPNARMAATGRGSGRRDSRRTPDGMQRLLNTSRWAVDAVRDDVVTSVREHLADSAAILDVDETGFLKGGHQMSASTHPACAAVGVQTQARRCPSTSPRWSPTGVTGSIGGAADRARACSLMRRRNCPPSTRCAGGSVRPAATDRKSVV